MQRGYSRGGERRGGGRSLTPPPPLTVVREVDTFPLPAAERCPNGGASRAVAGEDRIFSWPTATRCLGVGAPRWRSPPPPTGQGEVVAGEEWGEGGHTHPIPASEGLGGHSPPIGGDHDFPLLEMRDPHGSRSHPKVGYGGFFKLRSGGIALPLFAVLDGMSEEFFRWEEGDRNHPPHHPRGVRGCGAGPWLAASQEWAGAHTACGDDR